MHGTNNADKSKSFGSFISSNQKKKVQWLPDEFKGEVCQVYFLSRNALPITETELKLMAKAANMGDNSQPVKG